MIGSSQPQNPVVQSGPLALTGPDGYLKGDTGIHPTPGLLAPQAEQQQPGLLGSGILGMTAAEFEKLPAKTQRTWLEQAFGLSRK